MQRIKIDVPSSFSFSTSIRVRITDLNYGGHVGNDSILSIIHEARMQFLSSHGLSELNFSGTSLIMADVGIEFKNELFYESVLSCSVRASNFTRLGFDLYYKLSSNEKTVAIAKTGMICFNYETKKMATVPDSARERLEEKD